MSGIYGIDSDELLSILGPSWSAMTPAQRAAYGPEYEPLNVSHGLLAIDAVVDLAFRFPRSIADEGFTAIARRLRYPPPVLRLAEQLDHIDSLEDLEEPTPISNLVAKPATKTRSLMEDAA